MWQELGWYALAGRPVWPHDTKKAELIREQAPRNAYYFLPFLSVGKPRHGASIAVTAAALLYTSSGASGRLYAMLIRRSFSSTAAAMPARFTPTLPPNALRN